MVIYKSVFEKILKEFDLTKEYDALLEVKNTQLGKESEAILTLLTEYTIAVAKLQTEVDTARQKSEQARLQAEEYSAAQEELYVNEKMERWVRNRKYIFWVGIVFTAAILFFSVFLWLHLDDSGCLSLLGALAVSLYIVSFGKKAFSSEVKAKQRQQLLNDYHEKLKK